MSNTKTSTTSTLASAHNNDRAAAAATLSTTPIGRADVSTAHAAVGTLHADQSWILEHEDLLEREWVQFKKAFSSDKKRSTSSCVPLGQLAKKAVVSLKKKTVVAKKTAVPAKKRSSGNTTSTPETKTGKLYVAKAGLPPESTGTAATPILAFTPVSTAKAARTAPECGAIRVSSPTRFRYNV